MAAEGRRYPESALPPCSGTRSDRVQKHLFPAGLVNQYAPHGLRGDGEEVRAVLPTHAALVNESHVSFVDERGGLQSVVGALAAHVAVREPVQLLLNEREQLVERRPVAAAPGEEQTCHLFRRRRGFGHSNLPGGVPAVGAFGERRDCSTFPRGT